MVGSVSVVAEKPPSRVLSNCRLRPGTSNGRLVGTGTGSGRVGVQRSDVEARRARNETGGSEKRRLADEETKGRQKKPRGTSP
jgi:hypothetical protein